MDAASIERAAGLIHDARVARLPLQRLPDACRPADERDAYAVQAALNRRLTASGFGATVGHKIGTTTPVMQAYLNIPNPCAGEVFAPTVHRGHAQLTWSEYRRVGVECEIAVELAQDLGGRGPFTRAAAADAVSAVCASIEIVDDRYNDFPTLGTPTLIADDFFGAGDVLGASVGDWRRLDLATIGGRMLINGSEVGTGRGSDILGHPLEALAWLAGSMAARGSTLRAKSFVTLGSLVATHWVAAGDTVTIEIDGLGGASVAFT
jgi:2-keto-4-pentenoate hydratase